VTGCSTAPELTAEDRKRDIQFLCQWARDYNPFVELNEKHKGCPSYDALLPKYMEFAEQAQSNEEFFQVVSCYFNVIGASGHYYPLGEEMLKALKLGSLFGMVKLGDIKLRQYDQALYWARLRHNISTRAHPPFGIVYREGEYFTVDEWQHDGTTIPAGSKIVKVNGMNCSAYLDFIKENTSLRYDAYPKDWTKEYLLIIDEGDDFTGWDVDFVLADGSKHRAFVPRIKGFPAPKEEPVRTAEPKENCTCLELTKDVGYIRVKGFMGGVIDYVFRGFIKKDRAKIKRFLNRSKGKYRKLIVDIRNNGGGLPQYGYDNLISPFLDE
jgi:hypothetical protein